jgi:hypothetical protein
VCVCVAAPAAWGPPNQLPPRSLAAAQCFANELRGFLLALHLAAQQVPLLVAKSVYNLASCFSRSKASSLDWVEVMVEAGAPVLLEILAMSPEDKVGWAGQQKRTSS